MEKTTSIIDIPRQPKEEDFLQISKYENALIAFIKSSNSPMTIAIQGEWGSGKTSLMHQLQQQLCEGKQAAFYSIWLNTWQYSLFADSKETLAKIVLGLIQQIQTILETHYAETKDEVAKIARKIGGFLRTVGKVYIASQGGDHTVVDKEEPQAITIGELRDSLETILNQLLQKDPTKRGILFFIDDLDRIDPPVAVQILELLKNIFDIKRCIFVLAIDYDVVVKGLKPKFGEHTEQNDREFRSFFDKIIQLPFSMPVSRYTIDDFLFELLKTIGFLTESETRDGQFKTTVSSMARLSVGTNPRSLKRLANTLSLIKLISENDNDFTSLKKSLNFGLVCLQIAYPRVYKMLNKYPNFPEWNDAIAQEFKLQKIDEEELFRREEFDELWEQIVYRACVSDSYLHSRVFDISRLLNLIRTIVPNEENLEELLKELLETSSITHIEVSAEVGGKPLTAQQKIYLKLYTAIKEKLEQQLEESFSEVEPKRDYRIAVNPKIAIVFCVYGRKANILKVEIHLDKRCKSEAQQLSSQIMKRMQETFPFLPTEEKGEPLIIGIETVDDREQLPTLSDWAIQMGETAYNVLKYVES